MLSSALSSSVLPTPPAQTRSSPPDNAVGDRRPPIMLLLQLLRSLLLHRHEHSVAASDAAGEECGVSILHTCSICHLVRLLCHWTAARVALPERMDEHFLVLWMTRQQLRCGGESSEAAFADEREEDSGDGHGNRDAASFEPSTVAAGCSAACLLPVFDLDKDAARRSSPKREGPAMASTGQSMRMRDTAFQRRIDLLFQSLHDTTEDTDDRVARAVASPVKQTVAKLLDVYQTLKSDDSYLFQPTQLSNVHVALLLHLHAASLTELAALDLLRTLQPSPPLSAEVQLNAVIDAFHGLLDAQQSARAAVRYFSCSHCNDLLHTRIRPLLEALTRTSTPSSSTTSCFLHPHVELSADALYCVSGRGLVATGPLQEGELLLQEECMLALPVDAHDEGGVVQGGRHAKGLADALDHVLPDVEEPATAGTSCCGDTPATAEGVVDYLTRRPRSFAETWWYRWAVVLGDAPRPGAANTRIPLRESLRTCVRDAVLAACSHTSNSASSRESSSVSEGPASSPSTLRFASVRAVDEFHAPRPPPESVSQLFSKDLLLPALDPLLSDVLFCLLRFVNHACTPNAVVVYDAAPTNSCALTGTLVALRDIAAGEEVTISYLAATTALTVSPAELTHVLGFACCCALCTQKAALLHGVVCGECKQLVWTSPRQERSANASSKNGEAGASNTRVAASAFTHSKDCSHARQQSCLVNEDGDASDAAGGTSGFVARQLRRQLDGISAQITATESPAAAQDADGQRGVDNAAGDCACPRHSSSGASTAKDPLVAAVRQLVDLDDCVSHALLPTHHLRLRTRLEAFAYASVAQGLGSTVSAQLIELCASTIEELEVLLGPNNPLLTGLRMHLVFSRGRHVRAVQAAEAVAHGTRHADCCGAVREQAALMELPFVLDPLVRRCVTRCFQEHFVQLVGWKLPLTADATEEDVLWSFLRRYPVELEAAGITTPEHMELLACMADGESEVMR
ncbi:hypothetical protein ABB37_07590 [Leptomonas pyrrhocoris]|uniref:SET domain-containing protein n=1 Tax=Leptomonas pyrrhocoris TaxID=157538 RepID=A0A0M9FVF7_LEPPY|nr:hypothetical protein ABB37_07590 [Leptomonas pyrrhocoris]XP_015655207.1 hypothetical protein ABB37_07590 [Leptomonas pyrrhocoris]KPA76767.1 hypothetical protein ABB37_07590 [Leptomonas pyrrhocoris]KPA76768.1 hypothetical protein ABB37_07590 [Leptomonas pyrrhocoris]|eukprot:XP_015655206.1 hypothetical protein ABB37_07590 [Leptomonas pyrrhocoris]